MLSRLASSSPPTGLLYSREFRSRRPSQCLAQPQPSPRQATPRANLPGWPGCLVSLIFESLEALSAMLFIPRFRSSFFSAALAAPRRRPLFPPFISLHRLPQLPLLRSLQPRVNLLLQEPHPLSLVLRLELLSLRFCLLVYPVQNVDLELRKLGVPSRRFHSSSITRSTLSSTPISAVSSDFLMSSLMSLPLKVNLS